jgi:ABC-type transporter MlaC component
VSRARITVEDETVLIQHYTQEIADVAGAIHRVVSAWAASEKRSVAIETTQLAPCEEGF